MFFSILLENIKNLQTKAHIIYMKNYSLIVLFIGTVLSIIGAACLFCGMRKYIKFCYIIVQQMMTKTKWELSQVHIKNKQEEATKRYRPTSLRAYHAWDLFQDCILFNI